MRPSPKGLKGWLRTGAGNLAVLVLLLLLVEGGASVLLFLRDASWGPIAPRLRLHTSHDPDLGWVNVPGKVLPDMYGPGATLSTNGRGFRGRKETESSVPPGRIRVICSGDSFTWGTGIGDEDTWCHQLTDLDGRLEGVNLGQTGYGVDQAYLRYRRDGAPLAHDLHVFALIPHDIDRMELVEFLGYAKPILALDGEGLQVRNVPVPRRRPGIASWFARNAEPLHGLRSIQVLARLSPRFRPVRPPPSAEARESRSALTRRLVRLVLADLKRLNDARGSRLLLVLLPTEYELNGREPRELSAFLAEQAAALGIAYLDLFPAFLAVPADQRKLLFLTRVAAGAGAAGHYTRTGHTLVAGAIHSSLLTEGLIPSAESPR